MREEGFCEKHGPYDASLGRCPYCAEASGLPPAPRPLDDEMPTDPWGGQDRPGPVAYEYEEEETDFGFRARLAEEEEDITQLPERRRPEWDEDVTQWDRPPEAEGLLGFFIVKEGRRRGKIYRVEGGTTIGRKDANIRLSDDSKVSQQHAKLTIEDDQFTIWDFGSKNGTFVNGERIRAATPLNENDVIKVGDTVFVLKTLQ
jgi:hypothetical protein